MIGIPHTPYTQTYNTRHMHTHLYAYTHTYTQSITYTAVLYALTLLGPPSVTFKEAEGTML